MITLYLHLDGLENTVVDVEELPSMNDTLLLGRNPRRRDGKVTQYMLEEVNTIIFPVNRIVYIEVLTDEQEEEFETFIRE